MGCSMPLYTHITSYRISYSKCRIAKKWKYITNDLYSRSDARRGNAIVFYYIKITWSSFRKQIQNHLDTISGESDMCTMPFIYMEWTEWRNTDDVVDPENKVVSQLAPLFPIYDGISLFYTITGDSQVKYWMNGII